MTDPHDDRRPLPHPGRIEGLKRIFRQLLDEAERIHEENETAYQNLRAIRHRLMEARNLADLLQTLIDELDNLELDHVSLTLSQEIFLDRQDSLQDLPDAVGRRLKFLDPESLHKTMAPTGRPATFIGPITRPQDREIFGPDIRSGVRAPLVIHRRLLGSLNVGARSDNRFSADLSPEYLEDLAVTAALCLDNVITHEINEELAATDPLTGAFNRRFFFGYGNRSFHLARRHRDRLSVIYVDLNDFKPINDRFGHETGDRALLETANYIQERVRKTDVLARLGGDEFALLLPRVGLEEARRLSETLRQGIASIRFREETLKELRLSAAFGAAEIQPQDQRLEDLLARADQAMYLDKSKKSKDRTS